MGMPEDLLQLRAMIDEYIEGKVPQPHAFIFSSIGPCRHDHHDHYDYEHCMASQDDKEGEDAFDKLIDYVLGASEEYRDAHTEGT